MQHNIDIKQHKNDIKQNLSTVFTSETIDMAMILRKTIGAITAEIPLQ